jgi:hypothetical protein
MQLYTTAAAAAARVDLAEDAAEAFQMKMVPPLLTRRQQLREVLLQQANAESTTMTTTTATTKKKKMTSTKSLTRALTAPRTRRASHAVSVASHAATAVTTSATAVASSPLPLRQDLEYRKRRLLLENAAAEKAHIVADRCQFRVEFNAKNAAHATTAAAATTAAHKARLGVGFNSSVYAAGDKPVLSSLVCTNGAGAAGGKHVLSNIMRANSAIASTSQFQARSLSSSRSPPLSSPTSFWRGVTPVLKRGGVKVVSAVDAACLHAARRRTQSADNLRRIRQEYASSRAAVHFGEKEELIQPTPPPSRSLPSTSTLTTSPSTLSAASECVAVSKAAVRAAAAAVAAVVSPFDVQVSHKAALRARANYAYDATLRCLVVGK